MIRRLALARGTAITLVMGATLGLAGCGGGPDQGTQTGFVGGDRTVTLVAAEDRIPAPDLTGELLGGGDYSLGRDRGDDIVVINVWGSWCSPCRAEAAALQEVYQELQGDGVEFLGINTRDSAEAAEAFVRRYGITYPSLVDDGGELQLAFADSLPVAAIPTTIVIDRQGRVAARALSDVTYDDLHALLQPILDEAEP